MSNPPTSLNDSIQQLHEAFHFSTICRWLLGVLHHFHHRGGQAFFAHQRRMTALAKDFLTHERPGKSSKNTDIKNPKWIQGIKTILTSKPNLALELFWFFWGEGLSERDEFMKKCYVYIDCRALVSNGVSSMDSLIFCS